MLIISIIAAGFLGTMLAHTMIDAENHIAY